MTNGTTTTTSSSSSLRHHTNVHKQGAAGALGQKPGWMQQEQQQLRRVQDAV
jgi:hypothetical protein